MTAVIYARYSSDNQREESIEGQIRECTAYAEKNGITIWIALLHQEKPVHNVYWFFFFGAEEDLNSNDDDRSQRLKQGGVVGAAF